MHRVWRPGPSERILSRARMAARPYGAAFLGVLILMLLGWVPLVTPVALWFGIGAVTLAGLLVFSGDLLVRHYAGERLFPTGDPAVCRLWTLCGTPAVSLPLLTGPGVSAAAAQTQAEIAHLRIQMNQARDRVAQEALTSVARQAEATRVTLAISRSRSPAGRLQSAVCGRAR